MWPNTTGDALTEGYEAYSRMLQDLPDGKVLFLMRAILLLGVPVLLGRSVFRLGSRRIDLQILAVVTGMLLAFVVPIDASWFRPSGIRVVSVTLGVTVLIFLPWGFAFYSARQRRTQRRIRLGIYALLVLGFLLS